MIIFELPQYPHTHIDWLIDFSIGISEFLHLCTAPHHAYCVFFDITIILLKSAVMLSATVLSSSCDLWESPRLVWSDDLRHIPLISFFVIALEFFIVNSDSQNNFQFKLSNISEFTSWFLTGIHISGYYVNVLKYMCYS